MFYENGQSQEPYLNIALSYKQPSKNRVQVIRFGGQVSQKTFQIIVIAMSGHRTKKGKASIELTKS